MPPGSEWAHDVTLAWLLLVVAADGSRWATWSRIPGLAGIAVVFGLFPVVADPVAVALTIVALISVLRTDRSAATWAAVSVLAVSGLAGSAGGHQLALVRPRLDCCNCMGSGTWRLRLQ